MLKNWIGKKGVDSFKLILWYAPDILIIGLKIYEKVFGDQC